MTLIAIVQQAPAVLDRGACIATAAAHAGVAARAHGITILPRDLPARERLSPDDDEWLNGGDSVVVAPGARPDLFTLHVDRRPQQPVSPGDFR